MKPLVIQFSGGRTSAFMAKFLFEHFPEREKIVLFQNTGREDEKTLEFVLKCDREWDLRVVWLEAVTHHGERRGATHKIIDFESASRNGEPFEQVIKKYGIPFMFSSCCTRELKINVARSYLRSLGLKNGDYETAIGIRADEVHRVNRERAAKENIIYPLVDTIQVNKKFIKNWWAQQSFDLEVLPYVGNCDFCFKKPSITSFQSPATSRKNLTGGSEWKNFTAMSMRLSANRTFFFAGIERRRICAN